MPTQILVPGSNVSGNVGQCDTNVSVIPCATRQNFFICNDVGYATNSCTGQVDTFHSWSFSTGGGLTLFFVVLVCVVIGIVVLKALADHSE